MRLNGYEVINRAPSVKQPGMDVVMVHRPEHDYHPYVVAHWHERLKDTWVWGHYFETIEDAKNHYYGQLTC